jgi:hypothetical protein
MLTPSKTRKSEVGIDLPPRMAATVLTATEDGYGAFGNGGAGAAGVPAAECAGGESGRRM